MNTSEQPPQPPQWQRITPSCQPVFPCWLWQVRADLPNGGWWDRMTAFPPQEFGGHYTHWHPDQPTAPAIRPAAETPGHSVGPDGKPWPSLLPPPPASPTPSAASSFAVEVHQYDGKKSELHDNRDSRGARAGVRSAASETPTPRTDAEVRATFAWADRERFSSMELFAAKLERELGAAQNNSLHRQLTSQTRIDDLSHSLDVAQRELAARDAELAGLRGEVGRLTESRDRLIKQDANAAGCILSLRSELATLRADLQAHTALLVEHQKAKTGLIGALQIIARTEPQTVMNGNAKMEDPPHIKGGWNFHFIAREAIERFLAPPPPSTKKEGGA